MKKIIIFLISNLISFFSFSTNYYISGVGNDQNSGTSTSLAWRTIDRANQSVYSFQPGDQILFQKGYTYRGELYLGNSGNSQSPIIISSYGVGDLPVIDGTSVVSSWANHQGNIWKASLSSEPSQIYVNGNRINLARSPNIGNWYRNTQASNNQMTSLDLIQPNGYWNGCKAIIRSTASSVDILPIQSYSNSTLTFATNPLNNNMGNIDYGFYMVGRLDLIDSPGEWYWDQSSNLLYIWCPLSQNPNNLTIEASIYNCGIYLGWMRHHFNISSIYFKNQKYAGIQLDGSSNISISNCTLDGGYFGIRTYGDNNTYSNNTIKNTLATGALIISQSSINSSLLENNTFTNISRFVGEGESGWGYFGMRLIGNGITARLNVLDSIGYIGISCGDNQLIEKNVVKNSMVTLNDGAGIAFDNCDGLIIQDNIVYNIIGGIDGSPLTGPDAGVKYNVGIYFGNTSIKNTTVQRNTVKDIKGTGINVDHTMISTNLLIKENIVWNNDIQISISDYSNYNTPGASPPYYVPTFNDTYQNNIFYCLNENQLCMRQYHCYGENLVDYGDYSNNKYYNPYNDLTIMLYNVGYGGRKWYTLERWKIDRNEDLTSSRHNFNLSSYSTTQVLTPNLVPSGDFTSGSNGWETNKWPTNATISHNLQYLDNGCLKLYLPDNSIYPTLSTRSLDQFQIESNQWYRLKFSVLGPTLGDMFISIKGQSQLNTPYSLWEKQVAFSPERRDIESYFRVSISDPSSVQLLNYWTEPLYYLDNVTLHQVQKQDIDPLIFQTCLTNETSIDQSFILVGTWSDLNGISYNGSVSIPPFSSKILIKNNDNINYIKLKAFLDGPLNWSTKRMNKNLNIPLTTPYTNTISSQLSIPQDSIIDWVYLELISPQNSIIESRSALIKTNGEIVNSDGSNMIYFTSPISGNKIILKHRNHFGVMSSVLSNEQFIDFTSPQTSIYGISPVRTNGVINSLWSGDANADGIIRYTGINNDRDLILQSLGGSNPNNVISGYFDQDLNLDGVVKYTGTNNDRDVLFLTLSNSGLNHNQIKYQQLP